LGRDIDARLSNGDKVVALSFYDKRLMYPAFTRDLMEIILRGEIFSAESLPANIDQSSRMLIIKQLVKEGLITIVHPG
jgi:hypothetical protein